MRPFDAHLSFMEIKFRAYHKPTQKMYWFDIMNGNHGSGNGYIGMTPFGEEMSNSRHRDNMSQVDPTDCDIMRYTGLQDENGLDIIEGDILSFATQRKFGFQEDGKNVICHPVEFGNFFAKSDTLYQYIGFNINGGSIHYKLPHGLKVIGNIYETPELIKQ